MEKNANSQERVANVKGLINAHSARNVDTVQKNANTFTGNKSISKEKNPLNNKLFLQLKLKNRALKFKFKRKKEVLKRKMVNNSTTE